jgi:Family of unknown function (DUF5995)
MSRGTPWTRTEMLAPNPLLRVLSSLGLFSTGALPAPRSRAPRPPLVAPVCRTIDDVIERMTDLGDRFEEKHGPRDGVLCFNHLYLAVTRGVKSAVEQLGYFHNPDEIAQLDALFAQLYFDAVDAVDRGARPALAWRPLFAARDNQAILPIQFAVAGMNAHINHDLPIALCEQWKTECRRPSRSSDQYADFLKINQILEHEAKKEKRSLETGVLRALDRGQLGHLEDRLAMWVVEEARAGAWKDGSYLWYLRHFPLGQKLWIATIDRAAGTWGEALLEPV